MNGEYEYTCSREGGIYKSPTSDTPIADGFKMASRRKLAHITCLTYIRQMAETVNSMNECPEVNDEDMDYVMSLLSTYRQTLENSFFAFQVASGPIPTPQNGYSYSAYGLQNTYHEPFKGIFASDSESNIGGDQYDQERRDESKTE